MLQQQRHHIGLAFRCRLMQRRPSVRRPRLHIRPVLQQQLHHGYLADPSCRPMQRRPSVRRPRLHIRAVLQQQRQGFNISHAYGQMQRRPF